MYYYKEQKLEKKFKISFKTLKNNLKKKIKLINNNFFTSTKTLFLDKNIISLA